MGERKSTHGIVKSMYSINNLVLYLAYSVLSDMQKEEEEWHEKAKVRRPQE